MGITRMTQGMLAKHATGSLQINLNKMGMLQEQLSTGRRLNRPSDDPSGSNSAMRLRGSLNAVQQYGRNAQDGLGWLAITDSTLTTATDLANKARDIGLQGANSGTVSAAGREALAQTVEQLRGSLLQTANTTYLGRPVFGGITAGTEAYDATGAFVGQAGTVERTVADGVQVRVDSDGTAAYGPAGDTVFDHLTELAAALRGGDPTTIRTVTTKVNSDIDRLAAAHAEVGTRYQRIEVAQQRAADDELELTSSLSNVENVDLPQTIMDLQLQQTAYQAALGATARVVQPSLVDFLR